MATMRRGVIEKWAGSGEPLQLPEERETTRAPRGQAETDLPGRAQRKSAAEAKSSRNGTLPRARDFSRCRDPECYALP